MLLWWCLQSRNEISNTTKVNKMIVINDHCSIITLNINGLNSLIQRSRLAFWMRKHYLYYHCLQEICFIFKGVCEIQPLSMVKVLENTRLEEGRIQCIMATVINPKPVNAMYILLGSLCKFLLNRSNIETQRNLNTFTKPKITSHFLSDYNRTKFGISSERKSHKYTNSWILNNTLLNKAIEEMKKKSEKFFEIKMQYTKTAGI